MRQMQSVALLGFMATLVLTSASVLAVEVDVSIDKNRVSPGDTITMTGTIENEDGSTGTFEYRAAAIVAKHRNGGDRVIICDSGKQTTETGKVSFECKIPTIAELETLGVQNAADRAVIPIKAGISVRDPATNESEREHKKALIVNTEKFTTKFEDAQARLDKFIEHAQELMARCDNITARAEEAGAESVIDRCTNFQKKLQEQIDKALSAKERINNAIDNLGNLTEANFEDLKHGLINFRDGGRDFRIEVKDLREFVEKSRADLEKRVAKDIAERAKERAKALREEIKEKRGELEDRIMKVKELKMEKKDTKRLRATTTDIKPEKTEVETESEPDSSNSGSGSDGSSSSGSSGGA